MGADLVGRVNELRGGKVGKLIARRMREFKELGRKGNEEWFSELCFCILTANSTARRGMKIQRELGSKGFLTLPLEELRHKLRAAGHRFSNTRAHFIFEARRFRNIKNIIERFKDARQARGWLVENVRGLGYKESSHFLRNVGFDELAILDRHVLSVLHEYGLIDEVPRSLTRGRYMDIEEKLVGLAEKLGLTLGELDLYLWYLKTGKVLK
ncbi:MAG: N-glycosylase/DNA lyase [Hadesarchaea archaeon]|nr:N-glycosylase/DNA lyase [Hadesarchaea archaeon]